MRTILKRETVWEKHGGSSLKRDSNVRDWFHSSSPCPSLGTRLPSYSLLKTNSRSSQNKLKIRFDLRSQRKSPWPKAWVSDLLNKSGPIGLPFKRKRVWPSAYIAFTISDAFDHCWTINHQRRTQGKAEKYFNLQFVSKAWDSLEYRQLDGGNHPTRISDVHLSKYLTQQLFSIIL